MAKDDSAAALGTKERDKVSASQLAYRTAPSPRDGLKSWVAMVPDVDQLTS